MSSGDLVDSEQATARAVPKPPLIVHVGPVAAKAPSDFVDAQFANDRPRRLRPGGQPVSQVVPDDHSLNPEVSLLHADCVPTQWSRTSIMIPGLEWNGRVITMNRQIENPVLKETLTL